jgi:hypothetical protein
MRRLFTTVAALLLSTSSLLALDGKWTPQQVLEIDPAWLAAQGLELPPERLWDPARGTGLLAATVQIGGCSGGFISPAGLIITNHHCIFSMLQEHATPENDIIRNGFMAVSRDQELPSRTLRVSIARRYTDVTAPMVAAVPRRADDTARIGALRAKERQLIEECEKTPGARCRVAAFDGGVQYMLIESAELQDVRLVWAPPRAVGEYGGEIDNWTWPRHTGDFAIARAYMAPGGQFRPHHPENVPFDSEFFFPLATGGVNSSEFIMVLGYPGVTYRALTATEMEERADLFFPRREDVYGEWARLLNETTEGDPEGAIAVASTLKTLQNREKNAWGQIAALRRGRILEKQHEADARVVAWAAGRPAMRGALEAREGLRKMVEEQKATWDRNFLLNNLSVGPRPLHLAQQVAQASRERAKLDVERAADFTDRNFARTRDRLEREQKNLFGPADQAIVASFVQRALALPQNARITAIDRHFADAASEAEIVARIDRLWSGSRLLDAAERNRMLGETEAQLRARNDPLIELGFAIDDDLRRVKQQEDRWEGTVARLRPEWRRAVIAHAGIPIAPDANRTLRISFGHVQGYEPRDGVFFKPQTTLAGVVAKHTGEEPFDVPAAVRAAADERRFGRWKDEALDDVVVNFLADGDTTGGNSGSPVVNGRGELVGVNFDRVWENVANDFGFNPDVARNISADVRYMLWMLDEIDGSDYVLNELGIARER